MFYYWEEGEGLALRIGILKPGYVQYLRYERMHANNKLVFSVRLCDLVHLPQIFKHGRVLLDIDHKIPPTLGHWKIGSGIDELSYFMNLVSRSYNSCMNT